VYGWLRESPLALADGRRRWAADESVRGVEFGLAQSVEALDAAFRLVHDQYVRRGFMTPHPSGRRLGRHHARPTTRVFVATDRVRVVGTVTLIEDSQSGLPSDEIYQEELDTFRAQGLRLGEASALASDPTCRAAGLALVLRLMRLLVIYAADVAALDVLCVAVNPRHVEFYRRVLTFEIFGELRSYAKVNGAPAVGLGLDLDWVRKRAEATRNSPSEPHDLADVFFADHGRVAARLAEQVHAASAALRSLFGGRLDALLETDDTAPVLMGRVAE